MGSKRTDRRREQRRRKQQVRRSAPAESTTPSTRSPRTRSDPKTDPDWSRGCENCGARPIVPVTGMCGPCTFGEAATALGNW